MTAPRTSLFDPTPAERLDALAAFVERERAYTIKMLAERSDQRADWMARLMSAHEALYHIKHLRRVLADPARPAGASIAQVSA